MAVIKDAKDLKFPLPPKPADVLLKSTSSTMTNLLSPTYSTDVESLNTPTFTSHSKYFPSPLYKPWKFYHFPGKKIYS